jgi:RNA polymerase sigma-70 factor (ECF subfamily)
MIGTSTVQTGKAHTLSDLAADSGDLEMVLALRAGDEAAFVALLERHNAGMMRLARLITGDPVAADALNQETWLTILDRLEDYDRGISLKVWIFTTLLNCAAAYRQKRYPAGQAVTRLSISGGFPTKRLDSSADDQWPIVHAALTSLPLLQLAAVALRDVEGWRPDEVCAALRLSGPQADRLLHRARMTVSLAMGPYLSASRPTVGYASAC